jgi:hypothetical protein
MTLIHVISYVYFVIHRPLALNRILRIPIRLPKPLRQYLAPMETPGEAIEF